jgi:hypothetical protein
VGSGGVGQQLTLQLHAFRTEACRSQRPIRPPGVVAERRFPCLWIGQSACRPVKRYWGDPRHSGCSEPDAHHRSGLHQCACRMAQADHRSAQTRSIQLGKYTLLHRPFVQLPVIETGYCGRPVPFWILACPGCKLRASRTPPALSIWRLSGQLQTKHIAPDVWDT